MIVVAVLNAAARRRVAPCCDQLLSLSQNIFRTATGRLSSKHRARLSPDHLPQIDIIGAVVTVCSVRGENYQVSVCNTVRWTWWD